MLTFIKKQKQIFQRLAQEKTLHAVVIGHDVQVVDGGEPARLSRVRLQIGNHRIAGVQVICVFGCLDNRQQM